MPCYITTCWILFKVYAFAIISSTCGQIKHMALSYIVTVNNQKKNCIFLLCDNMKMPFGEMCSSNTLLRCNKNVQTIILNLNKENYELNPRLLENIHSIVTPIWKRAQIIRL